jgi:hypothetical protein
LAGQNPAPSKDSKRQSAVKLPFRLVAPAPHATQPVQDAKLGSLNAIYVPKRWDCVYTRVRKPVPGPVVRKMRDKLKRANGVSFDGSPSRARRSF